MPKNSADSFWFFTPVVGTFGNFMLLVGRGSNNYHSLSLAGIKTNEMFPKYTSTSTLCEVHVAYMYQWH